MKLNLESLKQINFKALVRGAGVREHALIHPAREWVTCLAVVTASALGLFGYIGFDFYTQYNASGATIVVEKSVVPSYSVSDAERIMRAYDARAQTFASMRAQAPVPVVAPAAEVMQETHSEQSSTLAGEEGEQYTNPAEESSPAEGQ
jgi:hypothetical protein